MTEPNPTPRKPWWRSGGFIKRVVVYGGLLVMLWAYAQIWASKVLYPASETVVPSPPPDPIQEVLLQGAEGKRVVGWFYPCPKPEAPIVLFFHGNAQNLSDLHESALFERLAAAGVHVFAIDFPGYGNSDGSPNEAHLYEAGAAAMDWLLMEHPDNPKIIMGWSLGAAVAVQTAATFKGSADGLILLSPWTSLFDVASHHFPRWLVRLLLKESYSSVVAAAEIDIPSLVIHGTEDSIIPFAQGEVMAQILGSKQPCQFVELKGFDHDMVFFSKLTWVHFGHFFRLMAEPR